jgi:hypothetical protein
VLLVEREMDELVFRAGPAPPGVHPLHWKGRVLMASRKGSRLAFGHGAPAAELLAFGHGAQGAF